MGQNTEWGYADSNNVKLWESGFARSSGLENERLPIKKKEPGSSITGLPVLLYDRNIETYISQEIERQLKAFPGTVIVDVRDITLEEATKEIREYFENHHGESLYALDVAIALSIDPDTVETVFENLARQGKIAEAEING